MDNHILDPQLKAEIQSLSFLLSKLLGKLQEHKMLSLGPQNLLELFSRVRSQMLNFDIKNPHKSEFPKLMMPVFDLINHSFKPNSYIKGVYDSSSDQSYLELRSAAKTGISSGEEITINYGNYSKTLHYWNPLSYRFLVATSLT